MQDLLAQARELHQQGDLPAAEAAYRAILAQNPDDADATHFLGVLARQTRRAAEGLGLIQRSVELAPHRAQFLYHLGNALDEDGRLDDAEAAYRRSIALAPANPLPLANLGLLLQSRQKTDDAIVLLQKAVALAPTQENRFNLARAYESASRHLESILELEQAVALNSSCPALIRLSGAFRRMGQLESSIQTVRKATDLFPQDATAWLSLARVLEVADQKAESLTAYRRVLDLQPTNAEAAFCLISADGPPPPAPPAELVRDLFDGAAESFDRQLQEKLGYDVPRQMAELLAATLQDADRGTAPPFDILDAGCGTGLAAAHLKPLSRALVGVDLSPQMIRQAQARNLYTDLHVGHITDFLRGHSASFDLIVALDVFIYIGDLQQVFAAAAAALRPRGIFAFSVESHTQENHPYILQPSRRYAQSAAYLAHLAQSCNFSQLAAQPHTLRQERGAPIPGLLLILQRA